MIEVAKEIRLHPAQEAFCESRAVYRAFVGGRGAGKSWVGAFDLICRARSERTYLVASPTYTILSDTTYRTFRSLARELGVLDTAKVSPPSMLLTTGAEVLFRSADDPEKLRGPNLSGVWLDEASLMHQDAYNIAIASLREAGEQGWLSATFTPKGLTHWTYEYFGRPRPDTELFHSRTADNPFNPEDFAATLSRQYVGQFALQELEGKFCAMSGAEWPAEYFGGHIWFEQWPTNVALRVLALDPSKGKDSKVPQDGREGDDSAYVELAYTGDGTVYVDADLNNQRDAQRIVEDGVAHLKRTKPHAFVLEVNTFQQLFALLFQQTCERENVPFPGYGCDNTVNKVVRIRTLGPVLAGVDGRFRFKANSPGAKRLVEQLRDFPVGDHDDGPDALEMGVRMLRFLLSGQRERGGPTILRT